MRKSCLKGCFCSKEIFTKQDQNVVICPPCGESVAGATKEGQNRKKALWPLLPRLTAVLPPQGREITARGFTLIELLVVVLIIGILAAVAVPQYQKAVEKSRLAEALTNISSLQKAMDIWVLANGSPDDPESFNSFCTGDGCPRLDIDLRDSRNFTYYAAYQGGCHILVERIQNEDLQYVLGSWREADGTWSKRCSYIAPYSQALCNSLIPQGYEVCDDCI